MPEIRPLPRFDQFQTNMENRTPKHTQTHSNQLISQAHIVTEHAQKKKNHKKIILNTLILLLKFHILLQKLKPLRAKGNAKKNRSGKMRLNSENLRFDDAVFCHVRAPIVTILLKKETRKWLYSARVTTLQSCDLQDFFLCPSFDRVFMPRRPRSVGRARCATGAASEPRFQRRAVRIDFSRLVEFMQRHV